ncbi:hypothetical protein [Pedococcus sp. 2YAF34]|uniref:hypothetical protein n=1 Tax=Pedococcus sp. 2YAF34 TaxID=3233032 RepID=UPI003F959D7C
MALTAICALAAAGPSATLPSAAGHESAPWHGATLAQFGPPTTHPPGPDGPGSFNATLPNGRRVTPAGTSVRVGQNPLNSALTEDSRFLLTSNDMERNAPPKTGSAVDPLDTQSGADAALSQYTVSVTDTSTTYDTQTEGIGTLTTLFFRSLDLAKHRAGMGGAADYEAQQNRLFAQAREAVEEG